MFTYTNLRGTDHKFSKTTCSILMGMTKGTAHKQQYKCNRTTIQVYRKEKDTKQKFGMPIQTD